MSACAHPTKARLVSTMLAIRDIGEIACLPWLSIHLVGFGADAIMTRERTKLRPSNILCSVEVQRLGHSLPIDQFEVLIDFAVRICIVLDHQQAIWIPRQRG